MDEITISLTFETIKQHFAAKLLTFFFHILKRTYRNALIIILFRRDWKSQSNTDDHWILLIPFTTYLDPNVSSEIARLYHHQALVELLSDYVTTSTTGLQNKNHMQARIRVSEVCWFYVNLRSHLNWNVLYQRWVVRITFEICKKNLTLQAYILLT